MLPLSRLSRHHPDAQVALQQSLILQDDNEQGNQRSIRNQGRSVICYESLKPFTQLNEHSRRYSPIATAYTYKAKGSTHNRVPFIKINEVMNGILILFPDQALSAQPEVNQTRLHLDP